MSTQEKLREQIDAWTLTMARVMGLTGIGFELFWDQLKNVGALVVFGTLCGLPEAWELHRAIKKGPQSKRGGNS